MRLICPNCDAEYEVDDAAIPLAGRDVQCSSCGHAWFQAHPETLSEPEEGPAVFGVEPARSRAETAYAEPEPESEPVPDAVPDLAPEPRSAEDATAVEDTSAAPEPLRRSIDESVLAVLREEAEREAAARRGERPRLETQTEMTLPETPRAPVRVEPPKAETPKVEMPEPPRVVVPEAPRKRELLPAIEKIKSSLHPTPEVEEDDDATTPAPQGGSFRTGFVFAVLIAVIILGLYVMAPVIVAKVPALRGTMVVYVQTINSLRAMLDHQVQGLIGWLKGLAGSSAG